MNANTIDPPKGANDAPIEGFSRCHQGIVTHLDALAELPALLAPAARVRTLAQNTLDFFRAAVPEHHRDEENELFPAVLASALAGAEHDRVKGLVQELTAEHRLIEAIWAKLEPELKKIARGQSFDMDAQVVDRLVQSYRAHAQFEEQHFLPLAQTILSRNSNHMAALGMSLHMRHTPVAIGYI